MLKARGESLDGMTRLVSGSGNVALYAIEKIHQLGGRVIACSDSDGVVIDDKGIDVALLKQVKEVERGRVRHCAERRADPRHLDRGSIWEVPCDVALPCATQNELTGRDAKLLVANGCTPGRRGSEHAHHNRGHPAVRRRRDRLRSRQSGQRRRGVATSALEMQQNASRDSWTFAHTAGAARRDHGRHPHAVP